MGAFIIKDETPDSEDVCHSTLFYYRKYTLFYYRKFQSSNTSRTTGHH